MKYDEKLMKGMAENLTEYLENLKYVVIEGLPHDEYKEARKTVKELIKKLKKGDGDAVFDKERYRQMIERGDLENE